MFIRNFFCLVVLFSLCGIGSAQAFVSCPVPSEGEPTVDCTQLVGQEEPQEVRDYLATGSYLIERSIKTTSGVYLCLMAVGIFQRYIRGRI